MTKKRKVGDTIEVEERGEVTRPDGSTVVVTGGTYVLSQTGTYVVSGGEVDVE